MQYWIEVSSEYRFKQKLAKEQGLYAPSINRYKIMLKQVEKGDLILHYIIQTGASKNYGSAIIGISLVSSKPERSTSRISVNLSQTNQLPIAIKHAEIKKIGKRSTLMDKILRLNFQIYFSEIELDDVVSLLKIHKENELFVREKNFIQF